MKVFVEINGPAARMSRPELSAYVRALEGAGATGVCVSDHLFASNNTDHGRELLPHCEPLTVLAAVAGISDRLELQTIVANTGWAHPGLLLRQFAQLAVIAGGHRVTAGLGAGWNGEEFESLGGSLPPFSDRAQRLEETLVVARQLFQEGEANLAGKSVTARHLPLSPRPAVPPRLLIGGGSDRLARLAGQFADIIDLQGHPKFGHVVGTVPEQQAADSRRRALTTVNDLAERMELVRSEAVAASRDGTAVKASVQIAYVAYGSRSRTETAESEIMARWAELPPGSLRQNPFVLLGDPKQIAETLEERAERFGLDRISLTERDDVPSAPADALQFCREVVPHLT